MRCDGIFRGQPYLSAYAIAVKHGFTGTEKEWLQSLSSIYAINAQMEEDGTFTHDSSLEMIGEAIEAGRTIILKCGDVTAFLYAFSEEEARFSTQMLINEDEETVFLDFSLSEECAWEERQVQGSEDHRELSHRSDADAHPMSAITGLNAAIEGAVTEAKGYAELVGNAVTADCKFYTDGKAGLAESNAKAYADTVQGAAEDYADEACAQILVTAKSYADDKASTAETNAKTYAAGLVAANPSGTATTTITKIKIGNVIYEVPQGSEGGKTVVTAEEGVSSMSAYDIYRTALTGVVEFEGDGMRLPLKYADASTAVFAGCAVLNSATVLVMTITGNTAVQSAVSVYAKPDTGIPSTDMTTAVRTSLGKADSAVQPADLTSFIPRGQQASKTASMTQEVGISTAGKLYVLPQKTWAQLVPDNGIPLTDLESAVQASLMKADTAYQKPSGGITWEDLQASIVTSLGLADTAYQKPSGGIPLSDFSTDAKNALKRNAITVEPFLSSQTQYTMSMSMSEIYAAYQAGKDVYIEYEDPYTFEKVDCRLIRIDGFDSAVFAGCKIASGAVTAIVFTAMNNLAEKSEIAIGGASSASAVTITDTAGYFTSGNVEGALAEIGAQLDGLEAALTALL